jgi:GNAT superfamily N-acetyltransferase
MNVLVREMQSADVPEADRIMRLAFGTFLGVPDPLTVFGDAHYAWPRFRARAVVKHVAEVGGKIVGSCFLTRWGEVAFIGPISVHPEHWNSGVAQRLLERAAAQIERWGVRQRSLFTFPNSTKHIYLYQKFGFWPRFLSAVLSKATGAAPASASHVRLSALPAAERREGLMACRDLCEALYEGLDLTDDIEALLEQGIGDVLLVQGDAADEGEIAAFALCHFGEGSEAGTQGLLVKFGAARPGPEASRSFTRLFDAAESLAVDVSASRLSTVVDLSHKEAFRALTARSFRADFMGLSMHGGDEVGYHRPELYVVDDVR